MHPNQSVQEVLRRKAVELSEVAEVDQEVEDKAAIEEAEEGSVEEVDEEVDLVRDGEAGGPIPTSQEVEEAFADEGHRAAFRKRGVWRLCGKVLCINHIRNCILFEN